MQGVINLDMEFKTEKLKFRVMQILKNVLETFQILRANS